MRTATRALAILDLFIDRIGSPVGTLQMVHDTAGRLRALDFEDCDARMHRLLRRHYGIAGRDFVLKPGSAAAPLRRALQGYFDGELAGIAAVRVATGGTVFQRQVWRALREIRAGTTTSYGSLARRLGRPDACRAVGLANAANPIGIVVPCHRVIGADGRLTGYGGGLERKRWLLTHERALLSRLLLRHHRIAPTLR